MNQNVRMIFVNGIKILLKDLLCKKVHSLTSSWQAANYLGIKTLLAVGCKTIANMVRGKASSEVREMFNISYDPPGEGLNAPNAIESQAGTVPTTQDTSATGPSPQPDPMN
ncbi:unnamed protein product [Rotaria magnacalcarata]|uniref:SKP1 component dimerisation domain-containing protein n=1 Tax=Rotaria magnacalcarata TaxID=392030 RepID=A0A8S3GBI0_9BILA|nr:unnamed protein product [Rotaria magnacalcarata]CAF5222285.1 unnamed protein product [Rotaria magnacalcarata]